MDDLAGGDRGHGATRVLPGRYDPDTCLTARTIGQSSVFWENGQIEPGIALVESVLRDSCRSCTEPCTLYAGLLLTLRLTQIHRLDQARVVFRGLRDQIDARGDRRLAATATLVNAKLSMVAGDPDEATELATAGLRAAEDTELRGWAPLGNFVLSLTALRRSDLATAVRYARRLQEAAIFGHDTLLVGPAAWVLLQITEAERGAREAASLATELLSSAVLLRKVLVTEPAALPWLVRLMLDCGQRDRAEQGVQAANRFLAENPCVPAAGAAAVHARGLFESDVDTLRQAAAMHTDLWARASALEDIGILLAYCDARRAERADHLRRAMAGFAQIGAFRDSCRVKSRLREIGPYTNPRDPGRPRSGVVGLTDTECAVAKLVARGLTNGQAAEQLFLSPHTVAFHLRNIFRKLGVTSRVQLASAWTDLECPDEDTDPPAPE